MFTLIQLSCPTSPEAAQWPFNETGVILAANDAAPFPALLAPLQNPPSNGSQTPDHDAPQTPPSNGPQTPTSGAPQTPPNVPQTPTSGAPQTPNNPMGRVIKGGTKGGFQILSEKRPLYRP